MSDTATDPDLDEAWDEAQEKAGQFTVLPDGSYQARVTESRVEEATWGETQFCLKFEDTAGAGSVRIWDSLEHPVGVAIAAEHAKALGYTGKRAGLVTACENGEFIDLICEIRVKTKPGEKRDFQQVYINRVLGKAAAGETLPDAGFAAPDDGDDIPF